MIAPKLRFSEFKDDWFETNLGKQTTYIKGFAFKSNEYQNEGIRIVRVSDLAQSAIKTNNEKIFIAFENSYKYVNWKIIKNDIIVTTVGSKPHLIDSAVGRPIFINKNNEGFLNQNLLLLRDIPELSNSYFIYSCLLDKRYLNHVEIIQRGNANQSNITVLDLMDFKFFTTSIQEQTKIAEFLSAVDDKISQLSRELELLNQYKKGVMQKIFSQEIRFKNDNGEDFGEWETDSIENVFTNKSKKFNPVKNKELPCIELEHLSQDTGMILGTISSLNQKSIKNYFKTGDVLYGKLRPYLRKFARPNFDGVCSTEIWVLDGIKVSNGYLFQFVQSEQFSELTNIQSGSKMPRAEWSIISNSEIEFPTKPEQKKIAEFLTAIDERIDHTTAQLTQTKQWKKGLLQQMFV